MAIVDFRSGGFQGAQPQRYAQDFPYGQDAQNSGYQEEWQEEDWDDPRYADAHRGVATEPQTLLARISRLTHYLGALVSVGLIIILAVWAFKLAVRDVSGVPVIRSMQGEARTAPTDPGGELTDRTGLAVNGVAAGNAAKVADKVAIAPVATGLETQDLAMGEFGATAQKPANPVELPLLDDTARVIPLPDGEAAALAESTIEPDEAIDTAVISDVPAAGEAPVNEVLTDLAGRETQDVAINQALAEANAMVPVPVAAAVQESPRPAPRPRRVASAQTVATDAAPAVAASRPAPEPAVAEEPAPAKVASGSAMVQIGAFDSDALAKGEWKRVAGKFGGLFDGKSRIVQEAQSGGRTFWRLRAGGFASKDEARKFCAALIAGGIDCIPATAK
ncbi:SPOR domain-containing protein [Paracoccus litorisediminis]|uniref:SPOR domain-containing protein n=1 Tax=Paracoccus litorisediminis TaxID=2006130 RepID=A0A844HJ66_9RHOB|nr:SPOR domain-containing protein [Paracoccus litorisediminis]MTH57841.1 SPOR domain-containing protein [Paracoccus litorisediminis]